MTERKTRKRRKFSREILGLLAVSLLIAVVLQQVLSIGTIGIIGHQLFLRGVELTHEQSVELDGWVFHISLLISVGFFVILFLFLLGERLAYIKEILTGIEALQNGREEHSVELVGNNELTQLAEAVNYLSRSQREVREKELALQEEKEQFIRELSHDIRTPLTSILSYSELLSENQELSRDRQGEYLELIRKKAGQIRELSDILLDGGKRAPEFFDNARLLMEQFADEFESMLEEQFSVSCDLSGCPAFAGRFDVQELHRIFDNLISNVKKYAHPDQSVKLTVELGEQGLLIRQTNGVVPVEKAPEGYQIGLRSIRRIAQAYQGQVTVIQEEQRFEISILLADVL